MRRSIAILASMLLIAPAAPAAAQDNASDSEAIFGSGTASYYGRELAGNRTASGERFDPNALTAAHRTLPFGSRVRVTNMDNGQSVVVRINDRGPFAHGRVIDVSHAAAREIGMHRSGLAPVSMSLIDEDNLAD
ncbi:septal ring lytic transglycosylase RlpA family protein [Sphingopyxis sp. MWB1]|uniref:septal ring lytic transglycosylase RlpA family protein n=1 Tax=Sphingopyxis sp. MWB1 TaxID=1537715 RepID=UPI00051A1FED|nr:septal ring lytic transglycosylase RlpA family protein [Sphingopyxis sp. MWB1]